MAALNQRFGVAVIGTRATIRKLVKYAADSQSAVYLAMQKAILIVEAEAKRLIANGYYQPAIQTGTLRASVSGNIVQFSAGKVVAEIGTGVYYAEYVHEGTKYMEERPFLVDALKNKRNEIRQLIREAFLGAGVKNAKFITGSKFRGK